jgi:hypothetical protein
MIFFYQNKAYYMSNFPGHKSRCNHYLKSTARFALVPGVTANYVLTYKNNRSKTCNMKSRQRRVH